MRPKLKYLAFAVLAILFFGPRRPCFALSIEDNSKDVTVRCHYALTVAAATASTAAVVIDLSDTVNYPHKIYSGSTGFLSISSVRVEVDKVAASTFTFKLGVVDAIDTSTGSVKWFLSDTNSLNVSNTNNTSFIFTNTQLTDLKVIPPVPNSGVDGTTPFIISNDSTSGSSIYQTDVVLPSPIPAGGVAPGLGDLVFSYAKDSTNVNNVTIDVWYSWQPF